MFQFFKDKLQYMKTERKFSRSPELPETSSKLTENLNDNLITIMEKYRNSSDFLKREIYWIGVVNKELELRREWTVES